MPSSPKEDAKSTVAGAKSRRSEVIERAQSAPQTITRKGTLAEFLLESPLRGAYLGIERLRDEPRDPPL